MPSYFFGLTHNGNGHVCLVVRFDELTNLRESNVDEMRIPRYPSSGWIGVDLDGTLAYTISPSHPSCIGDPVPLMLRRVRYWIETGRTVKIFTARASCSQQVSMIRSWCARHGIPGLEITNIKDHRMIALWDDRAVGVVTDLGLPILRPRRSIWFRVRWLVGLNTTTVFPFKCEYHEAES